MSAKYENVWISPAQGNSQGYPEMRNFKGTDTKAYLVCKFLLSAGKLSLLLLCTGLCCWLLYKSVTNDAQLKANEEKIAQLMGLLSLADKSSIDEERGRNLLRERRSIHHNHEQMRTEINQLTALVSDLQNRGGCLHSSFHLVPSYEDPNPTTRTGNLHWTSEPNDDDAAKVAHINGAITLDDDLGTITVNVAGHYFIYVQIFYSGHNGRPYRPSCSFIVWRKRENVEMTLMFASTTQENSYPSGGIVGLDNHNNSIMALDSVHLAAVFKFENEDIIGVKPDLISGHCYKNVYYTKTFFGGYKLS